MFFLPVTSVEILNLFSTRTNKQIINLDSSSSKEMKRKAGLPNLSLRRGYIASHKLPVTYFPTLRVPCVKKYAFFCLIYKSDQQTSPVHGCTAWCCVALLGTQLMFASQHVTWKSREICCGAWPLCAKISETLCRPNSTNGAKTSGIWGVKILFLSPDTAIKLAWEGLEGCERTIWLKAFSFVVWHSHCSPHRQSRTKPLCEDNPSKIISAKSEMSVLCKFWRHLELFSNTKSCLF